MRISRRSIPARSIWSSLPLLLFAIAAADVFTVNADRAFGRELDGGEAVIDLDGNVEVTDGEVTVTSDSGTVWQGSGNAVFYRNVVVVADTLTGTSDFLEYLKEAGMITMTGNVVLTDGESIVEADEVVYFRTSGKATARGSVLMTGPWLGSVEGEYALYDRDRGSLFVTVDPVLRRMESGDSLTLTADRLEFFPDDNTAEAQGNAFVDMPSREFTSSSEYLRYFGDEDRFELFGSPVMTTGDGEIEGDWMEIIMDGDQGPSAVRIEGGASGYFIDRGLQPPSETWFSSERAFFALEEGDPDSVMLTGSARLTVKSGGQAADREEMNTVTGNTFVIRFEDGDAAEVVVSGSVTGTYSYRGGDS